MAKHPVKLTDASFKRATKSGVALVDFWAPWCRPCRMVGPIVEEIAGELGDQVLVAKLNVDDNPKTARSSRRSSERGARVTTWERCRSSWRDAGGHPPFRPARACAGPCRVTWRRAGAGAR